MSLRVKSNFPKHGVATSFQGHPSIFFPREITVRISKYCLQEYINLEGKATDVFTFDAVKKKLSFHDCFRTLLPAWKALENDGEQGVNIPFPSPSTRVQNVGWMPVSMQTVRMSRHVTFPQIEEHR